MGPRVIVATWAAEILGDLCVAKVHLGYSPLTLVTRCEGKRLPL